jgi:hypothetical protein
LLLRQDKNKDGKYDIEELKSELAILKEALETFDAGTINKSIDNLGNIVRSGSVKTRILDISEKILIGEYEEAQDIVENLLIEHS